MTRPNCKHAYSERQIGFFGAVAGGHPNKETTMTSAQAKHHIKMAGKEGWNVSRAMGRSIKNKRGKK